VGSGKLRAQGFGKRLWLNAHLPFRETQKRRGLSHLIEQREPQPACSHHAVLRQPVACCTKV
jgi:hypothetical protein